MPGAPSRRRDVFVRRVEPYADKTLRPTAVRTDQDGVSPGRVAELSELGLLNHLAPAAYGGAAIDRGADRRLHELIAGGCFNTWLVWAQHAPLVGRLAIAAAQDAALSPLAERVLRGELLIGAAISDVRRYPGDHLRARRSRRGWIFSGTASWVSGWGLNTALAVAAVAEETETVITALVPVEEGIPATPLGLGVVRGSRTERVRLDDVLVAEEHVISTESLDQWRHKDLGVASDARPHHFGLAETVLLELEQAEHPLARQVAERWRPRVAAIRAQAYALSDEAARLGGDHRLTERLALKVASGDALSTLTRALVVARAGHGITTDDTAHLHAGSALFVLVQGQSADVRRAQLTQLAELAAPAPLTRPPIPDPEGIPDDPRVLVVHPQPDPSRPPRRLRRRGPQQPRHPRLPRRRARAERLDRCPARCGLVTSGHLHRGHRAGCPDDHVRAADRDPARLLAPRELRRRGRHAGPPVRWPGPGQHRVRQGRSRRLR